MTFKKIIVCFVLTFFSASQKITCKIELAVAISAFGYYSDKNKNSNSGQCNLTS